MDEQTDPRIAVGPRWAPRAPEAPDGAQHTGFLPPAGAQPPRPPVAPPPYPGPGGAVAAPPSPPTPPTNGSVQFPASPARPPARRGGGRRGIAAVLVVAAVFAAGAGGVVVGKDLVQDDATSSTATTSSDSGTVQTVSTVPGPVDADATEPAAAVAAALAPAVVQIETQAGLGSGFIYDESGLILTAGHVVDGSTAVQVRLADGRLVDGKVLGSDDATDVAVVSIEGVDDLTVATLATGVDLQVGQMAIAIGSPFGLDQSVTAGIVSALGRTTETPGGAIPAIQTDAPINSGNSGGALADRQGRVIGINDSIITGSQSSTGNVGIGFAIPIDIAKVVADRIVAGESTVGGYLGVRGTDATGDQSGSIIASVESGSPADEAGLQEGDLVTAVDGERVSSMIDLVAQISTNRPGDHVTLTVQRDGKSIEVPVTLGQAPGN
ncbi:MAG: trypsin-like peptidase domain-containing protein [Actinobacteria bacterium]|nr:trypsin-like peptidase domain-containing protein [Actinomycetota bacterium]